MLLLLIFSLFTVCLASPFHKYPFVFLLDVGNEELGKANAEQLKVSVPGGVLALKYPAVSDGPIIGHVRVTGIDFGTDLKASIVEGGPGYRYVVIVLMGAPGKQYDTVITVQTLEEEKQKIMSDGYKVQEDTNDSAEDTNEEANTSKYEEKNNEKMTKSDTYENEISIHEIETMNTRTNEDQNSSEDDSDYIGQVSSYRDDYSTKNEDIGESDSNKIKSDRIYTIPDPNELRDSEEEEHIDDNGDKTIKEKDFPNTDRTFVSVIPLNVLAGYGRLPGFYGNIMSFPQRDITQEKGLIGSESDDYSVINKDLNNNIDDYVSSVGY